MVPEQGDIEAEIKYRIILRQVIRPKKSLAAQGHIRIKKTVQGKKDRDL